MKRLLNAATTLMAMVFPLAAQTSITGVTTLNSGEHLNLDTGTTSLTGGDVQWLSSGQLDSLGDASIAILPSSVAASNFSSITQAQLTDYLYAFPVQIREPAAGSVFAVYTNDNNFSAVLVTAVVPDYSSITLQFITFHSPTISQVLNNYSQLDHRSLIN